MRDAFYGLELSPADAERIATLVTQGVYVQRSVMYGDEYTAVTWSFTSGDDDDDTDDPVSDSYMDELIRRGT